MKNFTFLICLLAYSLSSLGQDVITAPGIQGFSFVPEAGNYIMNWQPGNNNDDHWQISRIPRAERFSFQGSQVDPNLSPERKYWAWHILPGEARGSANFHANVMHFPQYRDMLALWVPGGGNLVFPPASFVDGCHKNGMKVLANITIADGTSTSSARWTHLFDKDANGHYKHAKKAVEIVKYYGLDGISINWEVYRMSGTYDAHAGKRWLQTLKEEAAALGMDDFEIGFYYVWYNSGNRNFWIKQLDSSNSEWLEYQGKTTTTAAFINYEWNSAGTANSRTEANRIGRSPYDVYMGINFDAIKTNRIKSFDAVKSNGVSLAFWGEPVRGSNLPANTDLEKEVKLIHDFTQYFSGPERNPSKTKAAYATQSPSDFGIANIYPAKSVIKQWPFATSFNPGNGIAWYENGQKIYSNNWSDMGTADIMPTWMWWWSKDGNGLQARINYEDAYYGGASVKISGNLSGENELKLYKTKLAVVNGSSCEITFKASELASQSSYASLALAFESGNGITNFSYIPLGLAANAGWNTKTIDLSQFAGQTLAVIGLKLEGNKNDYALSLGRMRLLNGTSQPAPAAPTELADTEITHDGTKFSVRLDWKLPNNPRYNKTANVEYFEIYQVNGDTNAKQLIGKSVHRGWVGRNIPVMSGNTNLKFEVVSVGADLTTKSQASPLTPIIPDFTTEKRAVGTGQQIKLVALDNNASSYAWKITGTQNLTMNGKTPVMTLNQPGFYTVALTIVNGENTKTITKPGYLSVIEGYGSEQISAKFSANKTALKQGDTVQFSFTGSSGTTALKKGVQLDAATKTGFKQEIMNGSTAWTFSWWYKFDSFYNGQAQFFKKKNSNGASDMDLYILPNGQMNFASAGKGNTMIEKGLIRLNEWNLYTMSYDGTTFKFYFNTKLVFSQDRPVNFVSDPSGQFYISNGPYKGAIDEVQVWNRALTNSEVGGINRQYSTAPTGLLSYWSLDNTLNNLVGNTSIVIYNKKTPLTTISYTNGNPWFFDNSGSSAFEWTFEGGTPNKSSKQNPAVVYNTAGTYGISLKVTSGAQSDTETKPSMITVNKPEPTNTVKMEHGKVSVNGNWQTVSLTNAYTKAVVVATPVLKGFDELPAVVRVRNVTQNSFDIKLQPAGSHSISAAREVHYLAVEEGVYTVEDHGVKMEANTANTTKTWYRWSPNTNIELRSFSNSYSYPVVIGQVMTANDADWSAFWCSDNAAAPVSASSFCAGIQVGEDPDKTRANETIGYIIIEKGSGSIGQIPYVAEKASDIVGIETNKNGVSYTLPSNELKGTLSAVASVDGMTRSNGGWANLFSASPVSAQTLKRTMDEDVMTDTERKHGTEGVSYLVLGAASPESSQRNSMLASDEEPAKAKANGAQIYPNPFEGVLYTEGLEDGTVYEIFSLTGSAVLEGKIKGKTINVSRLPSGSYIFRTGKIRMLIRKN